MNHVSCVQARARPGIGESRYSFVLVAFQIIVYILCREATKIT